MPLVASIFCCRRSDPDLQAAREYQRLNVKALELGGRELTLEEAADIMIELEWTPDGGPIE